MSMGRCDLKEKALPLCPIDEETLGRVAACYVLLDGPPESMFPSPLAGEGRGEG